MFVQIEMHKVVAQVRIYSHIYSRVKLLIILDIILLFMFHHSSSKNSFFCTFAKVNLIYEAVVIRKQCHLYFQIRPHKLCSVVRFKYEVLFVNETNASQSSIPISFLSFIQS